MLSGTVHGPVPVPMGCSMWVLSSVGFAVDCCAGKEQGDDSWMNGRKYSVQGEGRERQKEGREGTPPVLPRKTPAKRARPAGAVA